MSGRSSTIQAAAGTAKTDADRARRVETARPTAPWTGEALAGVVAALVTLAPVLTLGILAFAALDDASAIGIPAAFVTVAVGGVIVALQGRSTVPSGGLSSATVVLFAAETTRLALDPALAPANGAAVVACMALVVVAAGAIQLGFGLLRLGELAKFVPHPVLAGFMNAIAVVIVIAQVPMLLGIPLHAWGAGAARWSDVRPGAVSLGASVAVLIWLVGWRWPKAPAVLVGLAGGCVAYAALHAALPSVDVGQLVGTMPRALPDPGAWVETLASDAGASGLARRHAIELLSTAALIAIIGSLESILGALATDRDAGRRHDANRELILFGLANVVVGLLAALPVVYWRTRAFAIVRAGGRSYRAALAAALTTAALFLVVGTAVAWLPLAVLAGVMVALGVALVDRWTLALARQLAAGGRERRMLANLGVVAGVCGVTLWLGFLAGVALGMVASVALFVRSMNRSLVRERFDARARPSQRVYPAEREALIATERHRIAVLVLEGALFFGSVERLVDEVERLDDDTAVLILDLRRMTTLDASGAIALAQLRESLAARSIRLLLAGVSADNAHGRTLFAAGWQDRHARDWQPDADFAIEAAEALVVADAAAGSDRAPLALEATMLFGGLDTDQVARLRARMTPHRLAAGDTLFATGDPGDSLFVLTEGSISIVGGGEARSASLRFVSFSAGMMFGELAMLDGGARTAAARADEASVAFRLMQADLEALAAADPTLGARVYRNIATHLSQRLRSASLALRAAR